jgi:hypothetical protein
MKRTVVILSLALAFAAVGCRDRQSLTSPHRLSADFSDGRTTSGNQNFFFLPPLVGQPSFSGTFNPNLAPVVEICQLDVDPTTKIPIGCNTTVLPINPGPVQLDGTSQQYQVNWHTDAPAIDPSLFYRIQAFSSIQAFSLGTAPLGFADIDPVANGSQLKNVNTGEYIGLVDGRTLPIKFRIEQGATCFRLTACFEQLVGPNPTVLDVTTPPTNLVAVSFPKDYLQQTVTLTIAQVTSGCFDGSAPTLAAFGCYSISTSPLAVPPFTCANTAATCARVEVCPTLLVADPIYHDLRLYKADPPAPAQLLTEATAMLITNCEPWVPPSGLGSSGHRIGDLARGWYAVVNALRRLVMPAPAYGASAMAHLGLGGLTCCFSNFGWGRTSPALVMTASVSPTTLNIGGLEGTATVVITGTELSLTNATVLGSIRQGSASRPAGQSAPFSCAGSSCTPSPSFNFVANNNIEGGTGTLVCGSAEADFELMQGSALLRTYTTPITLSKLSGCP